MSITHAFLSTLRRLGASRDAIMLIVVAVLFYGFYYPAPYSQAHPHDVRIALVDEAPSPLSRELAERVDASPTARLSPPPPISPRRGIF